LTTLEAIDKIDFFNTLNDTQKLSLENISTLRTFSKNTIVYYEDDIDYSLQFLVSGVVKIYKIDKFNNEIFLYNIYSGNMISEFSSLDSDSIYCFSNAQFSEDGQMLSVNFEKFKKLFIDTAILVQPFIQEILSKTNKLQYIINRELVFDATAKVSFLISNDLTIINKLKRVQIAFMLHIQPETLSRVLKKLTKNNIISIEDNQINIIDGERLSSCFIGIGR